MRKSFFREPEQKKNQDYLRDRLLQVEVQSLASYEKQYSHIKQNESLTNAGQVPREENSSERRNYISVSNEFFEDADFFPG